MRQTIQELVERYQNSLYAVAFNVCKNQQDAEDAVQGKMLFRIRFSNIITAKKNLKVSSIYGHG